MRKKRPFATSESKRPARRLRGVFFGSSAFAVPSLRAVAREHDVLAVFTQADRPAGRGLKQQATPVKRAALGAALHVETPEKLDAHFCERVAQLQPDVLVTVSYGKILPAPLLAAPALGALNVHPSLLPVYRGATPIQAALRDGLTRTGVTVIWMTPKMDAGDIALAQTVAIDPSDDFQMLHDRLATTAADLIARALSQLSRGTLGRSPQDDTAATYTKPLTRDDARLDFADATHAANVVRSLSPRPSAWMLVSGKRVKVLEARAEPAAGMQSDGAGRAAVGAIVSLDGDGPLVQCRVGALRLLRVVPEGKPAMSGAQYARQLKSQSA